MHRDLQAVKNVLRECYGDKDAVSDELVDFILKPGLEVRLPEAVWDKTNHSCGK